MSKPTPSATQASSYAQFDELFADWVGPYVECARRFGAKAEVDAKTGAISQPYAPGRPTEQGLDADCVKEVGFPPKGPPLSESYLRGLYVLLVQQAACLRQHGYTISAPPSRDVWVENYDGTSWNPLMDVHNAGRDVGGADAVCPQPDPREAERIGFEQK